MTWQPPWCCSLLEKTFLTYCKDADKKTVQTYIYNLMLQQKYARKAISLLSVDLCLRCFRSSGCIDGSANSASLARVKHITLVLIVTVTRFLASLLF
eukprot:762605-Hanusia_phi.AAC.3